MNIILMSYISLALITLKFTHNYISHLFFIISTAIQPTIQQKLQFNQNFNQNIQDLQFNHFKWALIWTPLTLATIATSISQLLFNNINYEILAILIASTIVPIITFKKPSILQPTINIIDDTIKLIQLESADSQLQKLVNILSQVNDKKLILPIDDLEHIINQTKFFTSISKTLTSELKQPSE